MPRTKNEGEERLEAANAYSKERPEHFVEYCLESVSESEKATQDIRDLWSDLWDSYCNKMDFGDKEEWQSKIITNKPFTTVQQAKAIVRKALENPDYFTIEGINLLGKQVSPFVKAILDYHLNEQHGHFPLQAADATEMGFITGQSMEIIPQWDENSGLTITCVPPWHIFRDPDARRRNPWSGMYWIHREWIDRWELIQGQKEKIYNANVSKIESTDNYSANKTKDLSKKDIIWHRNKFRQNIEVFEFWGVVLDPKGELLLPNATFTIAGRQLIRNPRPNPYVKIRWPGSSFSPFSHLLRFEGRGLLEGVLTLWWLHNNMLSLHADAVSWAVNKIKEIDPSIAKYATNLELYPGAILERKAGQTNPIVTEVAGDAANIDMMPVYGYYDQLYENGSMVNQFVQGGAGTRPNITKGEVEIKTQMSLGIFDSIGSDVEAGLVNAVLGAIETIILNWGSNDILQTMGDEFPTEARQLAGMSKLDKVGFLKQNAIIRIQGISAQLKQAEMLERLQAFMKRLESPMWAKYTKPYELLIEFSKMIGYERPKFIATPGEAAKIDQIEAAVIAAASEEAKNAELLGQEMEVAKTKPINKPPAENREPGNPGSGDLTPPGF